MPEPDLLARVVGSPLSLEELKHKPGRRRTLRASGPRGSAIVKVYGSERAPVVAARIEALAAGPPEPVVPRVLLVDPERRVLVLTDVPGAPLREALLAGDLASCARAGAALGAWHTAWSGVTPDGLRPWSVERELEALRERATAASAPVAGALAEVLPSLVEPWESCTVVHRDLYEEQLLVGERVGLIDLDDAALGPPELDVGNLFAHVELLERRRDVELVVAIAALLEGYTEAGPVLDGALLDGCRRLSLSRLACLNDDASLVPPPLHA